MLHRTKSLAPSDFAWLEDSSTKSKNVAAHDDGSQTEPNRSRASASERISRVRQKTTTTGTIVAWRRLWYTTIKVVLASALPKSNVQTWCLPPGLQDEPEADEVSVRWGRRSFGLFRGRYNWEIVVRAWMASLGKLIQVPLLLKKSARRRFSRRQEEERKSGQADHVQCTVEASKREAWQNQSNIAARPPRTTDRSAASLLLWDNQISRPIT